MKAANNEDLIKVEAGEQAVNPVTVTQELSADGKVLTLSASNYFKGDYTVKVPFEMIKDVKGNFVKPVNEKVTVADVTAPVLESVKASVKSTTDKVTSLTLSFDEKVSSIEVVKIDGINYSASLNANGKTATISGLSLDATKSYDVTVVNAKDAANNTKDIQIGKLDITVDNVAPSVTKVDVIDEMTLKVTVDKALKNDTLSISGKIGTFTANVVKSVVVNEDNNKEYVVTLDKNYLYKSGNTDTVTLMVAKEALIDSLGNVNAAEITKTAVVSKDAAAPTVSKVDTTVVNGKVTKFTVNFREKVSALDASKVYVVNSKGEILSLSKVATPSIDAEDATKVVFDVDANVKADTYKLDLLEGFVTDQSIALNKNTKQSFSVNITDATKPVDTTFTIDGDNVTVANNVITVEFPELVKATGSGSALNPSAYSLNGVTLPADTKIEFAKVNSDINQKKVVITLPEGFVKTSDSKAVFRVIGVQTLDNKVNNAFIKTLDVKDNTAPVATSFAATDLTKLTVTYSEAIKFKAVTAPAENDVKDEIKLYNVKGEEIAITGATVSGDKLTLTVEDATLVTKLTTVASDTIDILDASDLAQKSGVVLSK